MNIFSVNLQISKRKNENRGYFTNEDVANYVASTLEGFENCTGTVAAIEVSDYDSVEAWRAAQAEAQDMKDRENWAAFYDGLTEGQKKLLGRYAQAPAPADAVDSDTDDSDTPDAQVDA